MALDDEDKLNRKDERPVGVNFKRRRLSDLSVDERVAILHAFLVDFRERSDIAREFRVSVALVSRLAYAAKKDRGVVGAWRSNEAKKESRQRALDLAVRLQLDDHGFISSVRAVKARLEAESGHILSNDSVRRLMKSQLGLSYKKLYHMQPRQNFPKSMISRQ